MASQDLESSHIGGRYFVVRRLGAGATAIVYLARDKQAGDAEVAVKILRKELAESGASERFLKEIRRTAKLEHPVILPVLDSGEHEGRPYFAMPYMEGGTLRQRLERARQLPIPDVLAIARKVADALDYANERGLIHRDVKPENILFTKGEARLADFGIARALQAVYGDGTTSSATIRGTPAYMSPEQASGSDSLDGRSDQYSLACVVYEMITGMQAFIGPTPEAVMAQRFKHTPREVSVYRPTAPAGLGPVLAKAFALSPADRYARCADFVDALASAPESLPATAIVPKRTWWAPAIGVAALAMIAWLAATGLPSASTPLDSTRIVVLPLETDGGAKPTGADDQFRQGFARYRDVSVVDAFQVSDALKRHGPVRTTEDAVAIAKQFGAGRFVRGRIVRVDTVWRASASVFDATSRASLYQASRVIPSGLDGASASYAGLADSLLLRGAAPDSVPVMPTGSRSLTAMQHVWSAQSALDDWDLVGADTALASAMKADPNYARANLWLAEVRAWQGRGRSAWGDLAEKAVRAGADLDPRERAIANGLVRMRDADYNGACTIFDSLTQRNEEDFAAWFGRGQCRSLDRIVVRDPRSRSGWRFRSSLHQAIHAYARALEVFPSSHRAFERGGYQRLRQLLFLQNTIFTGYSIEDSAQYQAFASWEGDSLVWIPYPWARVAAGDPETVPPGNAEAMRYQRALLQRIATRWSTLLPRQAGPKQAVAVALELAADSRAIDTLRAARALTTDSAKWRSIAATEARLILKFGAAGDTLALLRARNLADSVLGGRSTTIEDAEQMATVAALIGRCEQASDLMRRATPAAGYVRIPGQLLADAQALLARAALGCRLADPEVAFGQIGRAIDRAFATAPADERSRAYALLLMRSVILADRVGDVAVLRRTAESGNDVSRAALALATGDAGAARTALTAGDARPSAVLSTPDFVIARAGMWLALRDTARAVVELKESLSRSRDYDINTFDDAVNVAAFIRMCRLVARLDATSGNAWGTVATVLWAHADPELRALPRTVTLR